MSTLTSEERDTVLRMGGLFLKDKFGVGEKRSQACYGSLNVEKPF